MSIGADVAPESPGLFERLDAQLGAARLEVEFYSIHGAVMLQAFAASPGTAHVSAMFRPAGPVRDAVAEVARTAGVAEGWVQDAVRRVLGSGAGCGGATPGYVDLPHVRVFEPLPAYVLAIKCAAMRLKDDFQELDDVRFLLRALNITSTEHALEVIVPYFATRQLTEDTRINLEAILTA